MVYLVSVIILLCRCYKPARSYSVFQGRLHPEIKHQAVKNWSEQLHFTKHLHTGQEHRHEICNGRQ